MRFITVIVFLLLSFLCNGQNNNVAINNNGSSPDTNAILDINANKKGVLLPRMNTLQRDSINDPVNGLMIFNTDTGKFNYFYDRTWQAIGSKTPIDVYVDGSYVGPESGSSDEPFSTIAQALTFGNLNNSTSNEINFFIAGGDYSESFDLTSMDATLRFFGGYDGSNWERDTINQTTRILVLASGGKINNCTNILIDHITIKSGNAGTPGKTSYGLKINESYVSLNSCRINAGGGSQGNHGSSGNSGNIGATGLNGDPGCEDSIISCNTCPRPQGGNGGYIGSAGYAGGSGGDAGHETETGAGGLQGLGPIGGIGGEGTPPGGGASTPPSNAHGIIGGTANSGTPGTGGLNFGSITTAGYSLSIGGNGGIGNIGSGGGGGGGGGGGESGCDSYGSGGGGGGQGGSGGTGGQGGFGGGASVSVFIFNSIVNLNNCNLKSNSGGVGGNGGSGGAGGNGGVGGSGSNYGGSGEQDDGSLGGNGGSGGDGGDGGDGGGGGGGPSIGILYNAASTINNTNTTYLIGTGGEGGSATNPGQAGLSVETKQE